LKYFLGLCFNAEAFYDKLEKITYDSKDFKDFKELQNYIEESYWHQCGYVYGEFDSSIEIEFVMSDSRYGNITQKGFSVLIDFPYYEVLDTRSFLELMIEDWGYFMESVQYDGEYDEVKLDFSSCKFEYLPNKVLAKSMKDKEMIDLLVSTMNTHRGENTRNDFLSILKKYLYDFKKVKAHKIILDSLISGNLTFFPPSEEVSKALRETYDNLSVDEREEYREKISEVEKYLLECKENEEMSINPTKQIDDLEIEKYELQLLKQGFSKESIHHCLHKNKDVKGFDFIKCLQLYNREGAIKEKYPYKIIELCCEIDLGENPRDGFISCLEHYK
jgi:hypothetical protein